LEGQHHGDASLVLAYGVLQIADGAEGRAAVRGEVPVGVGGDELCRARLRRQAGR
jgi:hypothetical protein